jgi:succinate-semialdehyde dehydrogenase/glutarate-semialdehyde dehydrogenase
MITAEAHHLDLLVNGESKPSSDSQRIEIRSPANGNIVGSVPKATIADLDLTIKKAHEAFQKWSKLTSYEREKIIRKATTFVRTKADEIGRIMAMEQGKPLDQSRGEIISSCDTIDYYASEGPRIEGYTNPTESNDLRSWVNYQPVGVCALITPWNYPVSLLSWKLGPALTTGCTVVVKPTSVTPLSPLAFCKALTEGGLPAGVISVVTGSGATLGEALVKHPLIAKVAMTGSSATGKRLMEIGAPLLKKISLELGGQCPAIVCADADLDVAAKVIAYKGFRNMGQSCSSVNRVYVHRSVHDAFVKKLKTIAEKMTIGDGLSNGSVDLGPMTTADGLETTVEHIGDAVSKGADIVFGGKRPEGEAFKKGNYCLPTILAHTTHEMRVMREETFGPVVPIMAFDTTEEAVRLANDTSYGLVAYLFTKDFGTTTKISEALEAGTVCVNSGSVNTNYAPYSGWKDSGYGVELSRKAVFEYLKVKHVKVQLS